MTRQVVLFASVDTEEDNWQPARRDITAENIRDLPRLETFFEALGVRATYFVTYQVASRPWAASVLWEINESGRSEIGAHLHPWNTPPTPEPMSPRLTMTKNLPYELQLAKLEKLTETIRTELGISPVSFRAGRYGLSHDTVRALLHCGYRVDASVTPTVNWEGYDEGPNFEDASMFCHRIGASRDARSPIDGGLIEVPNSFGYSRRPFRLWNRVHGALAGDSIGRNWLLGLANRLGVIRKIVLTPELSSPRDMLLLSRLLIDEGVRHLQLFLHSPTLRPGLTPYTPTPDHVDRLYAAIEAYLEGLGAIADVRFATMGEAGTLLTHTPPSRSAT